MRGLFKRKNGLKTRVRTPVLMQIEASECGAACLGIVLAYFGNWVSPQKLREACNVSRDGSSAADVMKAARSFGMTTKAWKRELHQIPNVKMPSILFWQFRHFVVLEGVKPGRYFVNDPAVGRRVLGEEEFDRGFTGVVMEMEPGQSFIASGAPPGILELFLPWLKPARDAVSYAVICGLLLVIAGTATPLLLAAFVDHVIGGRQIELAWLVLTLATAVGLVSYALAWLQMKILRKTALALAISQSDRFVNRLLRLPMRFFTHHQAGDLTSRMQLIDVVALTGSVQLTGIIIEVVTSFVYLALMIYLAPVMSIGVFLLSALGIIVTRYVTLQRRDHNQQLLHEQGMMAGLGMGALSMVDLMTATASENTFFTRFTSYQARELNARQKFAELGHVTETVSPTLQILGAAIVIGAGGWQVLEGDMTLGTLVAFFILTTSFLQPVGRFAQLTDVLETLTANLRRLDDVFETEPDIELGHAQISGTGQVKTLNQRLKLLGHIELRNVTFNYSYREDSAPLIDNFSVSIQPGQRVAIVGPSGSGKSTLALLLAGIYQPASGEVLFDGHPRREIPREVLSGSLAMVDQNIFLFSGSVAENLTLWNPTIPDQAIVAAAKDAAIHTLITNRPLGYSSAVEENGRNFSGGERQRLEIARALVNNPTVLILDEASSALDAVSEGKIDAAIRRRGCTCVIIAHRLSTIRDSDLIIVMNKGKIVQRGTHDQLINDETDLYRELIQSE